MTRAKWERRVEGARKAFYDECERVADEVRERLVLPICKRHRLTFAAGMGSWSFYDDRYTDLGRHVVHDLDDAKRFPGLTKVMKAIQLEVDRNSDIGDYVRDVKPSDLDST